MESIAEQPDFGSPPGARMNRLNGMDNMALVMMSKDDFRTGSTPTERTEVTCTDATSVSSHSEIYREPGAGYNGADDEEK